MSVAQASSRSKSRPSDPSHSCPCMFFSYWPAGIACTVSFRQCLLISLWSHSLTRHPHPPPVITRMPQDSKPYQQIIFELIHEVRCPAIPSTFTINFVHRQSVFFPRFDGGTIEAPVHREEQSNIPQKPRGCEICWVAPITPTTLKALPALPRVKSKTLSKPLRTQSMNQPEGLGSLHAP